MDNELKQWLELLQSDEVSDRLVVVKTLQHLGDEEALEPLIIALKDETSPSVQKIALTALWELANPIAIPAMVAILGSPVADA
jgi:HEAT repeat protein